MTSDASTANEASAVARGFDPEARRDLPELRQLMGPYGDPVLAPVGLVGFLRVSRHLNGDCRVGGRLAAKAEVSDALLDKCKPIAGTPEDCIVALEEYREAGYSHVMLELWGDRRHEQIRLFGERVLPEVR